MEKVTLMDFSRVGIEQILKAEKAKFNQKENLWDFYNGRLIITKENGETSSINFSSYKYPLGQGPKELARIPKDANDMNLAQAIKAERMYKEAGNNKESRRMRVRIQEKFTLPSACLVFALIGSSFGIKSFSRSSKSQGFGLSILMIFGYSADSFYIIYDVATM